MKIMFIITVLSFAALAAAAFAIMRHIRNGVAAKPPQKAEGDLSQAIDARLTVLSRQENEPPQNRKPSAGQSLSFFNRDL